MRGFIKCLLLVLLLSSSAAAYTLVMRGGRRVEIAEGFRLSGAQLTYEAAPGVAVTLPLELVDVPATERANGEPAGSFLRRASANQDARDRRAADAQASAAATTRRAARTLTNRELEPARRARVESERAYERRRVELGLPSAEEARQRDREEESAMSERARQKAAEDEGSEDYWRDRASALREQAGALDAEIGYLRAVLADISNDSSVGFSSSPGLAAGALTVIAGPGAFFGRGGFPNFGRGGLANFGRGGLAGNIPAALHPANLAARNFGGRRFVGPGAFAGVRVNGGTRAVFGLDRRDPRGKFGGRFQRGRFTHRRSPFFGPGFVGFVGSFDYASADAYALVTRLRLLEGERAGLSARWRLLEEEARRAGALPGWLRP